MRCPWCAFDGAPRALHAHLADVHGDRVTFFERGGLSFYSVRCPSCEEAYEAQVKPRSRAPGFVEEFRREIGLVGFDMLINHLIAQHGEGGMPDG